MPPWFAEPNLAVRKQPLVQFAFLNVCASGRVAGGPGARKEGLFCCPFLKGGRDGWDLDRTHAPKQPRLINDTRPDRHEGEREEDGLVG